MSKKLKIDPTRVEYDGRSFKRIIHDEKEFMKELKKLQREILNSLKRNGSKVSF